MRVMELHAPVKLVQRSHGRTATAAAAYRAAARIECERTGQVHDYSRKRGVEDTQVLMPEGAPEWDRSTLWNQAELREKHPRALPARELEVAFPAEFSPEQRREAGLKIGRLLVARYGSAADLAWHAPPQHGDVRNHHMHALFTARPFENGQWAKTKSGRLDDLYGQGRDEMVELRAAVAGAMNEVAVKHNLAVFVEHASFKDRGLDREATQHLGPDAAEMERRGEPSDIGNKNREIEQRNAEREEAHEERNVLDFELERERLARENPQAELPQYRKRTPWELFYRDTQSRRESLLGELDQSYGRQEEEARAALEKINADRQARTLLGRFWWRITGRTRDEERVAAKHRDELRRTEMLRAERVRQFEQQRTQRLQQLKLDLARQEAEQDRRIADNLAALERSTERGEGRSEERHQMGAQDSAVIPQTAQTPPQTEQERSRQRIEERLKRMAEKKAQDNERGPGRGR